jgi:hypothetical protein
MEKAKRARKAETPKQPSRCLRLRAPYFYPDQGKTVGDNVGKLPWAAGTGHNLQGLSKRG